MEFIYDFKVREKDDKQPWSSIPTAKTTALDPGAKDFIENIEAIVATIRDQKEVQEIRYTRRGFCQAYFVS